jgi:Cytochrome c7 and related cytochrome c/Cytochrome c3
MARQRTQKNVSARIDRTYIKRRHRLRGLRRTTIFCCVAAAILFLALTTVTGRGDLIQNPGRLTFVHAKFQNNCGACHDGCDAEGRPTSKFSLAVSDGACLKCHDGAVHHLNQATMVVNDFRRVPAGPRSADCASCHAEHRGQAALVSANDLQCLQCHADLTGKTVNPPAPGVPMKVTDFTLEGHPHFGRAYLVDGKFVDPTDLRFGHEKHYSVDATGKATILQGAQRNCTWCHNPSPGAGEDAKFETGKGAFTLPGDEVGPPVALADGTGMHRSLNQVNYEKNCKSCHDLGSLPNSDIAIPHADMTQIRAVILAYCRDRSAAFLKYAKDTPGPKEKALNERIISRLGQNIPSDFSDELDALAKSVRADPLSPYLPLSDASAKLPPDLIAKLDAALAKVPANIMPKADKDRVTNAIAATTRPLDHLRPLLVARLRDAALKGLSGEAKTRTQLAFDAAMARYTQDSPDPRLLEVYVTVANEGGNNCTKCHDLEGSVAAVPPEWGGMQMVDRTVSEASVFRTKPTGIPAGPRRWYVNSVFNHDAHRSMNCVECHAQITQAKDKTNTISVFLPDIQWQGLEFTADGSSMVAATRSCVECHHPDDSTGPGAASNCTECHTYHDRTHELQPRPTPSDVLDGKLAPSNAPVAAAGG